MLFALLRIVATGRYLQLKIQELHEALQKAQETIGLANDERVQVRLSKPGTSSHQLAAMSTSLQAAEAAATFNGERARFAEWDANQLRGQLGLAQQDLARSRSDITAAIAQAQAQLSDLDDRLRASTALEREASARSAQQATSLAAMEARFQQSLLSRR